MNLRQVRASLTDADPGAVTAHGDYGEEPVFILDEDGFVHQIKYTTWDPDDRCFYISTKFVKEAAPDDSSTPDPTA